MYFLVIKSDFAISDCIQRINIYCQKILVALVTVFICELKNKKSSYH